VALLLSILTFIAVAVVAIALWFFFSFDTQQEVVRQRIEAVRKAEQHGELSVDLQLLRNEMYSSVPLVHRMLMRLSWSHDVNDFIAQSGLKTRLGALLMLSGVCFLGGYLVVQQLTRHAVAGLAAGLALMFVPIGFIAWKRSKRLKAFEEHFADALDLLGRAVRAGHAFTTGLEMISKESPEPIAGEFRKTFEEQNFGLPLRDSLLNLAERVPLIDVRFFVTALLIQKDTGGNLAEILDNLARLIRDRFRIYREVGVKTAQGRLTAMILVALPVVMVFVLEVLNPSYVGVLFTDPVGPLVLGGAAAMQVVGSLILWRIVHIEV
jgi:tight adherence protein B